MLFSRRPLWRNMIDVERVLNGSYNRALGIRLFEAFHGNAQVHRKLIRKKQLMRDKNNTKRRETLGM